jgi:hypothetical protein
MLTISLTPSLHLSHWAARALTNLSVSVFPIPSCHIPLSLGAEKTNHASKSSNVLQVFLLETVAKVLAMSLPVYFKSFRNKVLGRLISHCFIAAV